MKAFVIFVFLITPSLVFGQDPGGLVSCNGPDCNFCTFIEMTDAILDFLFMMLALLCVMMLMFAGFKLVTSGGNVHAWSEAKGMFSNIIIGFVIVLSAWLVVDTLLKVLLDDSSEGFGVWNEIDAGSCGTNRPMNAGME